MSDFTNLRHLKSLVYVGAQPSPCEERSLLLMSCRVLCSIVCCAVWYCCQYGVVECPFSVDVHLCSSVCLVML